MNSEQQGPRYTVSRKGYSIPHVWKYNDYQTEDAITRIILRDLQGTVVGAALIDSEDLDQVLRIAHWKLHPTKTVGLFYASGTARSVGNRRVLLHRVIMDAPAGMEVDHHNGNGLDCRKENMRITDEIGNANNRRHQRRERQLADALQRLLSCTHQDDSCKCRAYARGLLG